jgi:hypothetical protein
MDRLCELAPGWPLAAAYGVPLLASEGVAAVVALGTDWLAVRIDRLLANIRPWSRRPPGPSPGVTGTSWTRGKASFRRPMALACSAVRSQGR